MKQINLEDYVKSSENLKYICCTVNTDTKLVAKYKFKGRFYYYHHLTKWHPETGTTAESWWERE